MIYAAEGDRYSSSRKKIQPEIKLNDAKDFSNLARLLSRNAAKRL